MFNLCLYVITDIKADQNPKLPCPHHCHIQIRHKPLPADNLISSKVEKILKDSLDSIKSPLPSMKIQIMGGKVFLRCKGKTLLVVVNKLLRIKSLLTSPSNVLT